MCGSRRTRPARGSFNQSYHPAPLYSIKGKSNVIPIKHGLQTFHRSLRVPAVFSQDTPGVLNGANDGILVGIVHDGTQLHESGNQDWKQIFVPLWRCGFMSRRLNATVARSVYSRVGLIKPARLGPASHEHRGRRAAPDHRCLADEYRQWDARISPSVIFCSRVIQFFATKFAYV
jgi:hypothetical protein